MGLRFYFGSSGAGKSRQLQEEIVARSIREPERNFLFLVPDQFTMQTQMDLVLAHPSKGIMNIDVLSFGRLSHRILEEVGGESRAVLDDTGKSLLIRKVAQGILEHMPVIGANLHKIGYVHEVKSALSEFMQYGIGVPELTELIAFSGTRGALAHKLRDLCVLYEHFLTYIKEKYVTTEETLQLVGRLLSSSRLIEQSVIVFDGFTGFTPVQERLMQQLMERSSEMIVSLVMDAEENPFLQEGEQKLFYLSKKTAIRLERLAKEAGIGRGEDVYVKEKPYPRFLTNDKMQHLERYLFRYPYKAMEEEDMADGAIRMFQASTPGEEIRQVCLAIRRLIREDHYCYRDFAIVTGNLEEYAAHLEAETSKYEIPLYMDKTKGILLNPFTELIRSGLKIRSEQFSYRAVFHYLRSGLTGFAPEEADKLESYVLAAGIKGKKKWSGLFTALAEQVGAEELAKLNEMRERLMLQLAPLMESARTTGEHVRALYHFITGLSVQEKLAAYAAAFETKGEPARAREYAQIYRLVMDLLDQINGLLADEKMSRAEFAEILDAGFAEIQVGTIPSSVDKVVAGDIERTRLKEIKVLFFVGINDGNIPKNTGSGGLLSDIDREFLQESPYALSPTPRQQMYIQRLYLYMNMTKPSDRLILSYAKVDNEGKSLRPAYLIDTVRKLFPGLNVEAPELLPILSQLEAKKDGLDCFASMLRAYAAGRLSEEEERQLFTLYSRYQSDPAYEQGVRTLTDAAFLHYTDKPLGKAVVRALYGSLLSSSVSRLEQYAACAYAHFLKFGLKLAQRKDYAFEAVDMGNIFHQVLEDFAAGLGERGLTWFDFSGAAAEEILRKAVEAGAARYGETILYSSARNEYAVERMYRILKRTVMTLQTQLQKGSFLPERFELSFAMAEHLESFNIALSAEERIKLGGRIDRIDTYEDENNVYVKVIDYKSGNKKFDLAALYYGLQLQLVVYMNAAVEMEKEKHGGKEVKPAALLYYHVTDPMIRSEQELTPEEISAQLQKELRMNGVVTADDNIVSLLDSQFADKSDVIPVERKKDGSYSARSGILKEEDMREVSSYVNLKIKQIGREILGGSISLSPCEQKGASACDFCAYKPVCGFDKRIPGHQVRKLSSLKEEDVLARIREENRKEGPS